MFFYLSLLRVIHAVASVSDLFIVFDCRIIFQFMGIPQVLNSLTGMCTFKYFLLLVCLFLDFDSYS